MVWIIVGIFVAIGVGAGVFYGLRMLKGKIRMDLPKTAFLPGEEVNGSIHVLKQKSD